VGNFSLFFTPARGGRRGVKEKERKKGELEEWRKRKEEEELPSALYKFAPTAYF